MIPDYVGGSGNQESKNSVIKAVLMIRVENCPDICFPIVNLLTSPLIMYSKICLVKFGLISQMPKLARKCLMTGCYHKPFLVSLYVTNHM